MRKITFASILSLCMAPALFWSTESHAIPSWARKYEVSCYMCHSGMPQRNAIGEAFKNNGYRMPAGAEAAFTRQHQIKIGTDEWKKTINAPVNSSFPQFDPLSVLLTGNILNYVAPTHDSKGATVTTATFNYNVPGAVALFFGGSIGDQLTIFGEVNGFGGNSYFFFTSEALPEYLSNKEIISVITKLPPIVATEQIKNMLGKINAYVPFLGVLIKNTIGLNVSETKEEVEETLIMPSRALTLDSTEQKTEKLLAPAGLINLNKIIKHTQGLFKHDSSQQNNQIKKTYRSEEEKPASAINLDLGRVKSLNLARADSFLVKEKIFFKKKPGDFVLKLKNIFQVIVQIFNPQNWLSLIIKSKNWFRALNKKNSLLFGGLILVIIIFFGSIIFTNIQSKNKKAQAEFKNLATQIENQENSIDAHLLYNDNDGARADLIAAQSLISSLPREKSDQKIVYDQLENKLKEQSEKIQKLVKVTQVEKTNDLSGLNLNSIFLIAANIYASDETNIYSLTINSSSSSNIR